MSICQDHLDDTPNDNEAVKSIEQRHEIGLEAQAVHLQEHFQSEEGDEKYVGHLWKRRKEDSVQPLFTSIPYRTHLETRLTNPVDGNAPLRGHQYSGTRAL